MSTASGQVYIWDDVESLPPREMERLQVERPARRHRSGVSKTVPFLP